MAVKSHDSLLCIVGICVQVNHHLLDSPQRGVGNHEVSVYEKIATLRRHPMEIFSALLALSESNQPVTDEFPSQRPVTLSFSIFFDMRLSKRLSKQQRRWWFEALVHSLWRHFNGNEHRQIIGCFLMYRQHKCMQSPVPRFASWLVKWCGIDFVSTSSEIMSP